MEKSSMKLQSLVTAVGLSLLVSVAPAFAALPTVNTFTVAATAESPVPVTAFTASDSDGTVVGYMITQTSTKPAASDTRWTSSAWTQYTTTSIGALTLYAWAKDNSAGVSNSRTATTNVVGGHVHPMSQVTGLTAALAAKADIVHNHDTVYQQKYGKVAVVAQSGGDYSDPVIAMSNIALWCGTPSSSNPCLLKIMPGVYDLGSGTLSMVEHVDIEGSGENTTVITSIGGAATVLGAGNVELRFLTVRNTGMTGNAVAIRNSYLSSARLTNVTAIAFAGTSYSAGVYNTGSYVTMNNVTVIADGGYETYGILDDANGSLTMRNTNIIATGSVDSWNAFGIETFGSSVIMIDVACIAKGGVHSYGMYLRSGGGFLIDRSTIEGATGSVWNYGGTTRIGASKLVGGYSGAGPTTCVASYDGSYVPLNSVCQY
jgi:hypothetical protein